MRCHGGNMSRSQAVDECMWQNCTLSQDIGAKTLGDPHRQRINAASWCRAVKECMPHGCVTSSCGIAWCHDVVPLVHE